MYDKMFETVIESPKYDTETQSEFTLWKELYQKT